MLYSFTYNPHSSCFQLSNLLTHPMAYSAPALLRRRNSLSFLPILHSLNVRETNISSIIKILYQTDVVLLKYPPALVYLALSYKEEKLILFSHVISFLFLLPFQVEERSISIVIVVQTLLHYE